MKTVPRMLIVDDEEVITFALQSFFEQQGFDVDTESTAVQAALCLAAREYDVLIADLRLTGSGGMEGLELIRTAREQSAQTVIVLLTAYRTEAAETGALEAGANIVLQKPRPLPEVAQAIATLMNERG